MKKSELKQLIKECMLESVCWDGYERVPGTKEYESGSCRKKILKKFKVYVKDPKTGNVKKVNFGDPDMRIKKNNPERRKSFRARHNCDDPGPKTKARYWSCKKW